MRLLLNVLPKPCRMATTYDLWARVTKKSKFSGMKSSNPHPSTHLSAFWQDFCVHWVLTWLLPLGIWAARAAEGIERSCGSRTAACGLHGQAGWGWAAGRPVWSYTHSSCPEGAVREGETGDYFKTRLLCCTGRPNIRMARAFQLHANQKHRRPEIISRALKWPHHNNQRALV